MRARRRGVARRGEVLESPINGQRAVFRETAQDTGGELLRLDFFVAPGGFLGNEHLHPKQEERIEVLSGTLCCGLGRDGKTNEEGSPRLLQGAVMLEEFEDEYRLARPPLPVQKTVLAVLAPIGRLLGYRARYARYSEPA